MDCHDFLQMKTIKTAKKFCYFRWVSRGQRSWPLKLLSVLSYERNVG